MNIYITFFLILINTISIKAQEKNKYVKLEGKIKNFSNEMPLEDMSELKDLTSDNLISLIKSDSNGNFSIKFILKEANYFRLGRNIMYLSPNDNLNVIIDASNPANSYFKGIGEFANDFLKNTAFPKGGSYLEAGDNIKNSIEETMVEILKIANARKTNLHNQKKISLEFEYLEEARINCDILNSIKYLFMYYSATHKLPKDSIPIIKEKCKNLDSIYTAKFKKKLLNPKFLKLVVYRDILHSIMNDSNSIFSPQIKDYFRAKRIKKILDTTFLKPDFLKLQVQLKEIITYKYKKILSNEIERKLKFNNGDTALDLELKTYADKVKRLSEFKGKIIYIDLWATWCGPCVNELPYFDKLKEKYLNNQDIIFLSLSIDDEEDKWLKFVLKSKDFKNQFIIDRSKLKSYRVASIPRFILIDRNFIVVSLEAEMPSSPKIINQIERLLK